ncbi:MAG TPA: hypothetical protein VF780_08240 [Nitrosospira sp.]
MQFDLRRFPLWIILHSGFSGFAANGTANLADSPVTGTPHDYFA